MSMEARIVNVQPSRQIRGHDEFSVGTGAATPEAGRASLTDGERAEALATHLGIPLDELTARVEKRYCVEP